ncbi:hypothetical protein DC522_19155 [Microvirga sp. KLBC 81]|uniref:hypothetical protein n=1 Tax=Microvirga sp. KLBC 81 TaxID=1862707 RepID=UPI000D5191C6|nr:hypothetical protein [Microvirga sp. KLBC 81]PVE22767.1 hypothetical protein DC522_19155 [Microvirga sp. KLBC 81]
MPDPVFYTPLSEYLSQELWPSDLFVPSDGSFLDRIAYEDGMILAEEGTFSAQLAMRIMDEVVFQLPLGFAFVLGSGPVIASAHSGEDGLLVELFAEVLKLRLPRTLFKPVIEQDGKPVADPDPEHFVDIPLPLAISVDGDFNIDVEWPGESPGQLNLPRCMVGDSGVIISAENIVLRLSSNQELPEAAAAIGLDTDWKGVFIGAATVELPEGLGSAVPSDIKFSNAFIGDGGFSGEIDADWTPAFAGEVFGVTFGLEHLGLTFVQNSLEDSELAGTLTLPYFDEEVKVAIGLNLDGTFSAALSGESGLVTLTKAGVLRLDLDSIGFEYTGGTFIVKLSGQVTPLFGGLDWPAFQVKELAIDSSGNVRFEGGWMDLRDQYSLDFHGFKLEITKLGFGKTDDGTGKWIGFSGAIKLVDGLSAGASVEGLRLSWYDNGDVKVSLNGIAVELAIPDVLYFKGEVSYRELPGDIHRFDGDITLDLISLDMRVDAQLVIGTAGSGVDRYSFMAIYLGLELPAGIPLGATGLALYGMAGLFALEMEPDKLPEEAWFENDDASPGWYLRPTEGVSDLSTKWRPAEGSLALGAGVTLGTLSDNGYTFSGKLLLVIVFPGPVLLIEGRANLLKERAKLGEEAMFRALAVLDGREGTFLLNVAARYKYGSSAELIDIRANAEAFFDFSDADAWHLYLGENEPRERRIWAEIFQLFEANSYFMLDARQLAMGAWVGYDKNWKFGPLRVTVEAWIEGNVVVSWKPVYLHGDLWLHGKAGLKAFGFGLTLGVDAQFAANVFDPFHLLATFSVKIGLPWPLSDIKKTIKLEWGPEGDVPALPMPLKEIAIEHFKTTVSWPLPRAAVLLPNWDPDGDGFVNEGAVTAADIVALDTALPPAGVPVVPLDCRPHITFGRAVHDKPLVGSNVNFVEPPRERIGDPATNEGPLEVEYALRSIELHKLAGGTWSLVARRSDAGPPVGDLYGSWAPVAGAGTGGIAQVKLWLWSKSAFDYTRHSGGAWDEWFTDQFDDYPCVPQPPDRVICCDFESVPAGQVLSPPYHCPAHDWLAISWLYPPQTTVTVLEPAFRTFKHALCVPATIPVGAAGPQPNSILVSLRKPARAVRILVAGREGVGDRVGTCIDFRDRPGSRSSNPRTEEQVVFELQDAAGHRPPETTVDTRGGAAGLHCGHTLDVSLPLAVACVDLSVSLFSQGATIVAYSQDGSFASQARLPHAVNGAPQTIRLTGRSIKHVRLTAPQDEMLLHTLCFPLADGVADAQSQVTGMGFTTDGQVIGPVAPVAGVIDIQGPGLVRILVRGQACIVQVCVNIGPDPAQVELQQEMAQHLSDEMARWSRQGDVLEPHTDYRLKLVTHISASGIASKDIDLTEFAYFRTEGPPGLTALSTPAGQDAATFDSGLDDLARYVAYTVPSTVPAAGEKPPLPRPVYRAYDIGVAFNENYVDLMYRIAGRDLGLYLYDNNNRPVRDVSGRLIDVKNRWGVTEDLTLTESDNYWVTTVNGSDCAVIDTTLIPHNSTLGAADAGQVLDGDTLYEARLVPLLLHEAFAAHLVGDAATGSGAALGRWTVFDEGANGGPSHWEVREEGTPPSRYVIQTSNIWGGTVNANDPVKPGTLLVCADTPLLAPDHPEQPSNWTDYRVSVYLRSGDDDAIGVAVRYADPGHHYRFVMDRERRYRRLLKVYEGVTNVLAGDEFTYTQGRDYLLTVEAVGTSLRVYQDGELVFDASDESMSGGTVGLYCWANTGARFSDVRVDDFSLAASVVYRFQFTTSRYVNFFHHLHSYRDETWRAALSDAVAVAAAVGAAVAPAAAPSADEGRAFEQLAALAGVGSQPPPAEVQVTRLEIAQPFALLVHSPEPIAWSRTAIELLRATRPGAPVVAPRRAKLTDVSFATAEPNEESVTLLLQEPGSTTGLRIDYRTFPGALASSGPSNVLFAEAFEVTAGLLMREDFGPNALDHYTIVDEGISSGPSAWSVLAGAIVQTSNIYGGSTAGAAPEKPGTLAIAKDAQGWTNVRIRARFSTVDDDAIGVVFRFVDRDNYYRVSLDRELSYRRLVKKAGGVVTVLWEDGGNYDIGRSYELSIDAHGEHLIGYLDGVPLFNVRDTALARGAVGFYCWANTGARFEALEVESLDTDPVLWAPAFTGLDEVGIVDSGGAVAGPSLWEVDGGTLRQTSDINAPEDGVHFPGTYAYAGNPEWRDVQIHARLRSDDDDAIGVMFRYVDDDNYYRFSMDSERGYRRLIRKVAGVVSTLWQDPVGYTVGQGYDLSIRALGTELRAHLDGTPLFTVHDSALRAGGIGFYCWNNTGAHFDRVLVSDATRRIGAWTVTDEASASSPSVWALGGGALVQQSGIGDDAGPDYPGTFVVARGQSWMDSRLRVTVRADASGAVGVMFRYTDEDNYYRLTLDHQHNRRRLVRKQGGATTILFDAAGSYAIGGQTVLTVDAVGSHLVGYIGAERLFDVNDTAHPGGQMGLYCWRNTGARFEGVEVRVPPIEAHALLSDRFAEGDTSGWTFIDEGTSDAPSVWSTVGGALRQTSNIFELPIDRDTLGKRGTQALAGDPAWTDVVVSARLQSFDDGAIGLLFRYADDANFYRFSMDAQHGYRRLVKAVAGVFTLLWEDAVAYELGRPYEMTLTLVGNTLRGHLDGIPLFVVEDADVPAGRIGLYCWGNTDARFSRVHVYPAQMAFDEWLLDEPFNALAPATWTIVDDGTVDGPSDWQATGGLLRQAGAIHDGDLSAAAPEKFGTFAAAGSPSWTDYRLSVRLVSGEDDAIGVMFRYADADNYYRLSMDAQRGYRRLVKKVGGAVSVLWEANASYEVGREYLMTVECTGTHLSGYLDGVRLFALDDPDLAMGGIGLYCWGNVDARFAEVRVAPMTWETYHAFAAGDLLPAGTRVQVFSGNEAQAPSAAGQAGLVRHFVAMLADRGTIRLPATGVALRLVSGRDDVVHARSFLPEAAYQSIDDVRVLRKDDGTAFAVIVPTAAAPGSHLEPADYRLRLTYRRDNQALDPGSLVFSQAGVTADELVTLDVPWSSH